VSLSAPGTHPFAATRAGDAAPPAPHPLLAGVRDPRIVLTWLTRLRWLAVLGQVAAIAVATAWLRLHLPVAAIAAIVLTTLLTNVALAAWLARAPAPARGASVAATLLIAVLFLDVGLLTALLYLTGGPLNPFATLYIIHVVMAVVALSPTWAWAVVLTSAGSYAALFRFHVPLVSDRPIDPRVMYAGTWFALVLEAVLIAYFVGRVMRNLRLHEEELQHARERASRNEQLAALTTLAAGAAHELGTPLGTIGLVAKELELAIERSGGRDGDMAEDARLIRREVDRCRKILDRMRVDIVRDIAQQSRVVAVSELIDLILGDLPDEDRPRLRVTLAADVPSVRAPPRAVQQAVGVMIRNAFDASPDGAEVELLTRWADDRAAVAIEVRDRGPGMPPEIARRAGEPFFTTKAPGKGMGLGLFLVRLVAEQSNGRWYLDSRPGNGTRSVLELPPA
jgi:two-component system sensor histidine kinase RegB